MIGRLPKIRRRRDRGQDKPVGAQDFAPTAEQPTIVAGHSAPAGPPAAPLPADVPPAAGDAQHQPSFRDRGRFRRRLRYLRRVRELGFRDLGGLVFDQHRFARPAEALVGGKLTALAAVDRELRALERALDDRRTFIDLREPGIAACPRCAALHGSDARFCPSCGMRLSGPLAVAEVGEGAVGAPPPSMAPAPAAPPETTAVSTARPDPSPMAGTRAPAPTSMPEAAVSPQSATTAQTSPPTQATATDAPRADAATPPVVDAPAPAADDATPPVLEAPAPAGVDVTQTSAGDDASPPVADLDAGQAGDAPGEDQPTSAWMPPPGDAGDEPPAGEPADAKRAPADRRKT